MVKLNDVLERHLKDIAQGSTAAGFAHRARDELVRGGVDVIDFDTGKTFFECRQDNLRVNLRQGGVKIQRAFLERRLVQLVERLAARRRNRTGSERDYKREAQRQKISNHRANLPKPDYISDSATVDSNFEPRVKPPLT